MASALADQSCMQEAMKAIPDHVLDAAPPQLDALPAFSLPQPLHPGIAPSRMPGAAPAH